MLWTSRSSEKTRWWEEEQEVLIYSGGLHSGVCRSSIWYTRRMACSSIFIWRVFSARNRFSFSSSRLIIESNGGILNSLRRKKHVVSFVRLKRKSKKKVSIKYDVISFNVKKGTWTRQQWKQSGVSSLTVDENDWKEGEKSKWWYRLERKQECIKLVELSLTHLPMAEQSLEFSSVCLSTHLYLPDAYLFTCSFLLLWKLVGLSFWSLLDDGFDLPLSLLIRSCD